MENEVEEKWKVKCRLGLHSGLWGLGFSDLGKLYSLVASI